MQVEISMEHPVNEVKSGAGTISKPSLFRSENVAPNNQDQDIILLDKESNWEYYNEGNGSKYVDKEFVKKDDLLVTEAVQWLRPKDTQPNDYKILVFNNKITQNDIE